MRREFVRMLPAEMHLVINSFGRSPDFPLAIRSYPDSATTSRMMQKTQIVLVSCAATKRARVCEARDLYASALFTK